MGHSDLSVGEALAAPEPVGVAPVDQFKRLQAARDAAFDPLGIFAPIVHAQIAWMLHPQELAERLSRFATEAAALQVHSLKHLAGVREPERVRPNADDLRFSDRIWNDAPQWSLLKQWYLFLTRHAQDGLFDTPGLSPKERRRAAFWWRKWLNAVAPTNFLLSNPVAMRMAVETRGESLARGAQNFLDDMAAGTVRMSNTEDFVVGGNLATTPGAVVFRNRLLELIHYAPQTGQVHQVPIVIVTPWINKFYVLDLQPRNSLVQYLVKQGFSVFITSWKNPTPEMAQVGFEDYLTDGVAEAVRVASGLTGAPQVHAVGYCIGGTLLATYMAWLNRRHELAEEAPVAHWSLLASLVDFQSPGDIEVFIDEGSVRWLGSLMRWRGVLDGKEMATTFRLLRSNSLIWHYAVHGWLYGERVKPMDVLFWNMDTTRMPYRMHEFYLRELYLENRLVKPDALTIAGQPIDLERIRQPLYGVSAEDDHITPWRQTFRINNRFKARKRFVLSSSGHILGIVNPPVTPPRRSFRVGAAHRRQSADTWHAGAEQFDGSWWEDWVAWLKPQCGPLVTAPPVTSDTYPALAAAPGTYVLEQ